MRLARIVAMIGGWRGSAALLAIAATAAWAAWSDHLDTVREVERNAVTIERDAATRDLERTLRDDQANNLDAAGRGDVRDRLRDLDTPFFANPDGMRNAVPGVADVAD